MSSDASPALPRLFYDDGPLDFVWPRWQRSAARALWHWHSALTDPDLEGVDDATSAVFEREQERVEAGEPVRIVPSAVWQEAYSACADHGLDRKWLGRQVRAARAFHGSTRFETPEGLETFVQRWAVSHGRLLAQLAGVDLAVRLDHAEELARGFFYLARLLRLPADLAEDRLFLSLKTIRERDVYIEQLRSGPPDENVQGVLWREGVRVRDALAQGRPLMGALSLRHRFFLKRAWVGAVELLDVLERRDYDLWNRPPTLTVGRRLCVYLRLLFGRSGAR